jgi:hypothetical protein
MFFLMDLPDIDTKNNLNREGHRHEGATRGSPDVVLSASMPIRLVGVSQRMPRRRVANRMRPSAA